MKKSVRQCPTGKTFSFDIDPYEIKTFKISESASNYLLKCRIGKGISCFVKTIIVVW